MPCKPILLKSLFFLLTGVLGMACKKNQTEEPFSRENTLARLGKGLEMQAETRILPEASADVWFVFNSGCLLNVENLELVNASGAVMPKPYAISVLPVFRTGEMIRQQSTTMGPSGMFISGGGFSIRFESGGLPCKPNTENGAFQFYLPANSPSARAQNFQVWNPIFLSASAEPKVPFWVPAFDKELNKQRISSSDFFNGKWYQSVFIQDSGSFSLGLKYPDSGQKTEVQVKVPEKFGLENSICYAIFPNLNAAVRLYGFDATSNMFHSAGYGLPASTACTFICIGLIGENWYWGSTPGSTSNTGASLEMQMRTREAILESLTVL
jgi:hypothetical protein